MAALVGAPPIRQVGLRARRRGDASLRPFLGRGMLPLTKPAPKRATKLAGNLTRKRVFNKNQDPLDELGYLIAEASKNVVFVLGAGVSVPAAIRDGVR